MSQPVKYYAVEVENDLDHLIKEINSLMSETPPVGISNWCPLGGIAITSYAANFKANIVYTQTLVRYKSTQ